MGKDLLVIIPAFNEEDVIGKFLDTLDSHGVYKYADVLVINDGSTDATSFIVRDKGVQVVTHSYNLGYGCALQTGYKYAVRKGYEYLIQIDSDGQHDVCNIDTIYAAMKESEDESEIILGSRFLESSISFHISFPKKIIINIFRIIIRFSTKQIVLDPTSGLQGLRRRAFLYCSFYDNFVPDYPDANLIIQLLLNRFHIKEVPAVMHERKTGTSMHSGLKPILYLLKIFLNTIAVILREKLFNKQK